MKMNMFFIFLLGLSISACQQEAKQEKQQNTKISTEIPFKVEGNLYFISTKGDTLHSIEIEVAANEARRAQGLMNRSSLPKNGGMLFIFEEQEDELSFWMRNTLISLDLIFLNEQKEVVHIAKYTQIQSDAPIASTAPSQYVVEVNAGFADTHKIEIGSRAIWQLAP